MKRFPGFIDICTEISAGKWDKVTGKAVRCGYSSLIAVPVAEKLFTEKADVLQALYEPEEKALCDYAKIAVITPENIHSISEWANEVPAAYVDSTLFESAGSFARMNLLTRLFNRWPAEKPICVSGNEGQIGSAIFMAQVHKRKVHICSVATRQEIEMIHEARTSGVSVTCDIHPLSLLISSENRTTPGILKKPGTEDDRQALWQYFRDIDCFSLSNFSNRRGDCTEALELMVPLLFSMKKSEMLTDEDILLRCCLNPARIFGIKLDPTTVIEMDETGEGPTRAVKVKKASIHGQTVYSSDTPDTVSAVRASRIKGFSV